MIEPCLCGKAVLVGPHTENFRPVMSDLLEARAIEVVPTAAALAKRVEELLSRGDGGLGLRAQECVARRRGVVPRCVQEIRGFLA